MVITIADYVPAEVRESRIWRRYELDIGMTHATSRFLHLFSAVARKPLHERADLLTWMGLRRKNSTNWPRITEPALMAGWTLGPITVT